jgi:hypothetical protein
LLSNLSGLLFFLLFLSTLKDTQLDSSGSLDRLSKKLIVEFIGSTILGDMPLATHLDHWCEFQVNLYVPDFDEIDFFD